MPSVLRRPWFDYSRRIAERLPADLVVVILLVLLTVLSVLTPVIRETPLRLLLGIPFTIFLPGYAAVSVLYPRSGTRDGTWMGNDSGADLAMDSPGQSRWTQRSSIDSFERVVYSVALSIIIIPLVGYLLHLSTVGIQFRTFLLTVSGMTIGLTVLAIHRRRSVPADDRFRVPFRRWFGDILAWSRQATEEDDRLLDWLIVIVAIGTLVTLAIGVTISPSQGERFTEVYLTTEEEGTEELITEGYPTTFELHEGRSLTLVIENSEQRKVTYIVSVELQRLATDTSSAHITNRAQLLKLRATVKHDRRAEISHTLVPTMAGDRLRVQYLVYEDRAPQVPTEETADYTLHLWIDVSG